MATGITNALVDYAQTLKYEDIPPEVLERTKHMLLDFLGVAYGGLRTGESSGPVIDGVLDLASGAAGESAVLGRPRAAARALRRAPECHVRPQHGLRRHPPRRCHPHRHAALRHAPRAC